MLTFERSKLIQLVNTALETIERDEWVVGIRFENKFRNVGEEITECSKSNEDREEERDFPEYGTDDYNEMEELDGISTYDIDQWEEFNLTSGKNFFNCEHIYLIGCTEYTNGEDDGEFIMEDAIVLATII